MESLLWLSMNSEGTLCRGQLVDQADRHMGLQGPEMLRQTHAGRLPRTLVGAVNLGRADCS